LVFLLLLPPHLALNRRRKETGLARQLTEAADYLHQVAAIYQSFTGPHLHRLDATLPVEEIHATILQITLAALARHREEAQKPPPEWSS